MGQNTLFVVIIFLVLTATTVAPLVENKILPTLLLSTVAKQCFGGYPVYVVNGVPCLSSLETLEAGKHYQLGTLLECKIINKTKLANTLQYIVYVQCTYMADTHGTYLANPSRSW